MVDFTKTNLSASFRRFENTSANIASRFSSGHTPKATILCYHNIVTDVSDSESQPDSVWTRDFEKQMLFLRNNNYNVISLQKLEKDLVSGKLPENNAVVITFDDGYKSVFINAFPILIKYNIPAVVFLAVNYIGKKSFPWLFSSNGSYYCADSSPLCWDEVAKLHQAGIEIGSHSCSHSFLPKLDETKIEKELFESSNIIRDILKESPRAFALPFSFPMKHRAWPHFQTILLSSLEKGGYTSCCTSCRGHINSKSRLYLLKRIFIDKYDNLSSFHSKLVGAYAWTRFPQLIYQRFFKNYDN